VLSKNSEEKVKKAKNTSQGNNDVMDNFTDRNLVKGDEEETE
jgi:hypothetical protein